jgi:hypothetical protein
MAKSEAEFANEQADESFGAGCNIVKCDLERTQRMRHHCEDIIADENRGIRR